jgi:hypothetical protein
MSTSFFASLPLMAALLWCFLRLKPAPFSAAAGLGIALSVGAPALVAMAMEAGSRPATSTERQIADAKAQKLNLGQSSGHPSLGIPRDDKTIVSERLQLILDVVNRFAAVHEGRYPARLEEAGQRDLEYVKENGARLSYGNDGTWSSPLPRELIVARGLESEKDGFHSIVIYADGNVVVFPTKVASDQANQLSSEAEGAMARRPPTDPEAADAARRVAIDWLTALGVGDIDTIKNLSDRMPAEVADAMQDSFASIRELREAGQAKFGDTLPPAPDAEQLRKTYDGLQARLIGDVAMVPVPSADGANLKLCHVGGQWKIDSMSFEAGPDGDAARKLAVAHFKILANLGREVARDVTDGRFTSWAATLAILSRRFLVAESRSTEVQDAKRALGSRALTLAGSPFGPFATPTVRSQPVQQGTQAQAHPPQPRPQPQRDPPHGTSKTDMIGGNGGGPYVNAPAELRSVVGFRYVMGQWSRNDGRNDVLRHFDPIFDGEKDLPQYNDGDAKEIRAKDGYVVGGIIVDGDDVNVLALKVIFLRRLANGSLDVKDRYVTDWIGFPENLKQQQLAGNGEQIVGTFGRQGLNLAAIGLVFTPAAVTQPAK